MLRITPTITSDAMTLLVEGTLSGPWVAALQAQLESPSKPLLLDLSGVTFIDSQGAVLIQSACQRGATIKAASHFVSLMLQNTSASNYNSHTGKEG